MVQARKRSAFNYILFAALSLGAAAAVFTPSTAHAGDDEGDASGACTAKKFHYPAVEKACKAGGRKEVKKLMKTAIKKAKADGKKWKCKSCHEDLKKYDLTDDAVKDLKPYI